MDLEDYTDFEKMKEIIKNNSIKINELNNKLKQIKRTSFDEKIIATILSSTFTILVLSLILSFNIDAILVLPTLIKLIPLSPTIIMFFSFFSSHITSNLFDSVKCKNISKSKKIINKLEEEYSCEIEILKTKNKNTSYKKAFKSICLNKNSSKTIISNKITSSKENIQNFENHLDNLFKKLDILTTKQYLNNKLTEAKKQKFIITKSFGFGLLTMLLSSLPLIILNISAVTFLFSSTSVVISGIIGTISYLTGSLNENRNMVKTLTKINNGLNENKLSDNENISDLESQIKDTIDNIYVLQVILYEQEKKLLKIDEEVQNEVIINNSLNNEQLVENQLIVSEDKSTRQSGPKLVKVIKRKLQ